MIDAIIILAYVALACSIAAIAFSLWRTTLSRRRSWKNYRTAAGVAAMVVGALLLGYIIGGTVPDMFIIGIFILFFIALLTICLSIVHTKYLR